MIYLKKIFLFLLSLILFFNFSFSLFLKAGYDGDNLGFSDESDSNLEGGGDGKDNYKNSFWYGKVEDVDGKFGINI